ncbi:MAG: LysE family translocator [Candidatus Bathyarchaeota archaeon]|nr:LysE family translocator [Candidatus Bathyarchaeota archaeon]MDH5713404.1 LysE family translocator [Candidatus Bathyarchaeota archaeon]
MDILTLIVTVVIISVSGALAPGPLFFATISYGTKLGAKSGLAFSIAHTVIEFPLVILLAILVAFGSRNIADESIIRLLIAVAGGLALLVLGALQIHNGLSSKFTVSSESGVASKNPLFVGLVLTGLNPFFIGWWLTVGLKLIVDAWAFAFLAGIGIMYFSHIWMDYVWLIAVAHFAKMGMNVVGAKGYRAVVIVFGAVLIFFGLLFLTSIF